MLKYSNVLKKLKTCEKVKHPFSSSDHETSMLVPSGGKLTHIINAGTGAMRGGGIFFN